MTIPNQKKTLTDSALFARLYLRILDRADQANERYLIPLQYNSTQRDLLKNQGKKNLILKARQHGISTMIQAEFFRLSLISTVTTATLAHDDATTQKLRRMTDRFYHNFPKFRDCEFPAKRYANATLSMYSDFDAEGIIATGGSKHIGRGGTYTHIHCSEIAFYADTESIMAGILQGGNPTLYLESTPNGAQGYFYEKCMEALDGNGNYVFHFYPWWLDTEYRIPLLPDEIITFTDEELALVTKHNLTPEQIKWRRDKQIELKHLFAQEYPEDSRSCFLMSGNGYFGDVSFACVIAPDSLSYDPAHRYYGGLDFGQSNDYTVCTIIDKTTFQQVDILRINRLSWAEMRRQIKDLLAKWQVEACYAEANSIGAPNLESLQFEGLPIVPFTTTNISKGMIMAGLHEAIHTSGLKLLNNPIQRDELQKMISKQTPSGVWQIAAAGTGHDDTVIALALAVYGCQQTLQVFFIE
jgi:hypothetical protein